MIDLRGGILAVTICIVIALINDMPRPVKDNQTPYCVIVEKVAQKDQFGNWHVGWGRGFGPCNLQDEFSSSQPRLRRNNGD